MATAGVTSIPAPIETFPTAAAAPNSTVPNVCLLGPNSTVASVDLEVKAPFTAIRTLFDHLYAHQHDAVALNATYPLRGILKTSAMLKTASDQKFTIDLSPKRNTLIPVPLQQSLADHGLTETLEFFDTASSYVPNILNSLSVLAGVDLAKAHKDWVMNFRLCDYNPDTAAPQSDNGCGSHTDYGTFSIIFQDGTSGLELEDANAPGTWVPVPGDATIILTGWCAVVLSGGRISAAKHRVRRVPGVRRLSAVLFVAPDLDVALKPLEGVLPARQFSDTVMKGEMIVNTFKQVMGKRWRYREGNEEMTNGEDATQDTDIEALIWA